MSNFFSYIENLKRILCVIIIYHIFLLILNCLTIAKNGKFVELCRIPSNGVKMWGTAKSGSVVPHPAETAAAAGVQPAQERRPNAVGRYAGADLFSNAK